MALISSLSAVKHDIPHEPGEWMRIRPLKASDEALIQRDYPTPVDRELAILKAIIVEWSYDAPLTEGAVDDIDRETLRWLDTEILPPLLAVMRSEDEKKDYSSGLGSTPPRPARSRSRQSSNT